MKKTILKIGLGLLGVLVIIGLILFLSFQKIAVVSKGEPISNYSSPKTALLIIDVQKTLTEKNGSWILNLEQTDNMIDNINKIIGKAKENATPVIYIQNVFKKNTIINCMTKRVMEEGTYGTEIDDRINIVSTNKFVKNKMDAFTNADFENFLIENEINHLVITGIDADACVDKTIKGALNRKYKITVIRDAIATKTDEKLVEKINDFKSLGITILSTEELNN